MYLLSSVRVGALTGAGCCCCCWGCCVEPASCQTLIDVLEPSIVEAEPTNFFPMRLYRFVPHACLEHGWHLPSLTVKLLLPSPLELSWAHIIPRRRCAFSLPEAVPLRRASTADNVTTKNASPVPPPPHTASQRPMVSVL